MKKYILLLFAFAVVFAGCTDKNESAYFNEARLQGLKAAKLIIEHKDTTRLALEGMILDAVAVRSGYLLDGDTAAAESFQKSFEGYIKSKDRELAKQMF